MNLLILANTIASIGCFCGIMCIAHKRRIGFIIFFIVELCMLYIGYKTNQYGIMLMAVIYFFSNVYAYTLWGKIK